MEPKKLTLILYLGSGHTMIVDVECDNIEDYLEYLNDTLTKLAIGVMNRYDMWDKNFRWYAADIRSYEVL